MHRSDSVCQEGPGGVWGYIRHVCKVYGRSAWGKKNECGSHWYERGAMGTACGQVLDWEGYLGVLGSVQKMLYRSGMVCKVLHELGKARKKGMDWGGCMGVCKLCIPGQPSDSRLYNK